MIIAGIMGATIFSVPTSLFVRRTFRAQAMDLKRAREDAAEARSTSVKVSLQMIELSQQHSTRLAEIASETRNVHDIVNHRTTALQRRTAYLARRVATDHPEDAEAQDEALLAEGDAMASQARQDAMARQDEWAGATGEISR